MEQLLEEATSANRRFRRYESYRNSGVEWLGEIPAHWEVKRLKVLASVELSNVDKKSVEGEEPVSLCNYTDVYYNERIAEDMNFMAATATPEQVRRFSLRAGDVLITKDSESWTDIAVPALIAEDLPGVLCGYHLAHIRPRTQALGPFLSRAFSAVGPRDQFQVASNGITRFGLGGDAIRAGLFAVPPEPEQRAIAAFLDRETARIDALVPKKERLIELLQEQRTALITRAVTKGLDPTVPTKDSGLEWLGQIPGHWDVHSTGRVIGGIEQGWSPVAEDRQAGPDEWGVIKLSAVARGVFVPNEHKALPTGLAPDVRYEIRDGDFLITRSNTPELVGDVCVVRRPPARLMLCDLVYRLDLRLNAITPEFLAFWFLSRAGRHQIEVEARGSSQSMVKVSQGLIRAWTVVLPSTTEQRGIAAFLDRETARLDTLIAKVRDAIERLKELRTALISAAVTGKIDVREEIAA
jgi:type I restriction enzyme S subunit